MEAFYKRMQKLLPPGAEWQKFQSLLEQKEKSPSKKQRINPFYANHNNWISKSLTKLSAQESKDHWLSATGACFLQDFSAYSIIEKHLNLAPGDKILDLCAAPGAKSTQIIEKFFEHREAAKLNFLVANDINKTRAKHLDLILARHGWPAHLSCSLGPKKLCQILENCFDIVLVDAPCSSESFFFKRKDHRRDVRDREVLLCAKRQIEILLSAVQALRSGGQIIYSTCTFSEEENEKVIEAFLKEHPDFECLSQEKHWPHKSLGAGGFVAVLRHKEIKTPCNEEEFFRKIKNISSKEGLIRNTVFNWKNEIDQYALSQFKNLAGSEQSRALLAFQETLNFGTKDIALINTELQKPVLELEQNQLFHYLEGQSIELPKNKKRAFAFARYKGLTIGNLKLIEGRANNLFAKKLRIKLPRPKQAN